MPVDLSKSSYPAWLETTERLRDGTEIHLRPLRAEDETLLEDLAAHMSREDLRLRFFAAVRGLSHAVAARLSHIDYDRAMALLAEKDGVALGVARFFAEEDRRRAEYAIAVRSDWKGHGLGYLLSFAQSTYNAALMFALIVLILVVVLLIFGIAGRLEKYLLRWQ